MTTQEDMQQLSARLAGLRRRQQLEGIQEAYDVLDAAIDDATELSKDERCSLREWGNVNFGLLQQDDVDEDECSDDDKSTPSPLEVIKALTEVIRFMTAQHEKGDGLPEDHPVLPAVDLICRWLRPATEAQNNHH